MTALMAAVAACSSPQATVAPTAAPVTPPQAAQVITSTPGPVLATATADLVQQGPPPVRLEQVAAGLSYPTALAWGPAPATAVGQTGPVLYVATNGQAFPATRATLGEIYWLDGATPRPFASGINRPVGLLWIDSAGEPELIVSSRGKVAAWRDTDGDGIGKETRVLLDDLPAWSLHQNNSPVLGPDGLIYLGMGTKTNADTAAEAPLNGTILRFPPTIDPSQAPEVFATGFRNPFDMAFTADGALFATDNGADPPVVAEAPDELNLVVQGGFYGHPAVFGADTPDAAAEARHPVAPIALFPTHASADGMLRYAGDMFPELRDHLIVAEFGSFLAGFEHAGRRLVVAALTHEAEGYRADVMPLVPDFPGRPVDVVEGPDGSLYVADFESDVVWRVVRDTAAAP